MHGLPWLALPACAALLRWGSFAALAAIAKATGQRSWPAQLCCAAAQYTVAYGHISVTTAQLLLLPTAARAVLRQLRCHGQLRWPNNTKYSYLR